MKNRPNEQDGSTGPLFYAERVSKRETDVQKLWSTFVHTHTAHLTDPLPSATPQSRAQTRDSLRTHLDALHVMQSRLSQRMNWLTAIYLLPDELLSRIFVYVCAARTPNPPPPTDLMMVCHRWCSVIQTFPGTWAYPPLYTSRAKVDALLSRSKSSALHICWELRGIRPIEFETTGAPDGERLLAPIVARSRTITLEASSPVLAGIVGQMGSARPASNLETLVVVVDSSLPRARARMTAATPQTRMTPAVWPKQMFDTPRLRHLKLSNFSYFDWSHPLLCDTLTALEIGFYDSSWAMQNPLNNPGPAEAAPCSYSRLLDVLGRLRSLEKLILVRCVSTSLILDPDFDEQRKIDMKTLRILNMYDKPGACATLHRTLRLHHDALALYMNNWTGPTDAADIVTFATALSPSIENIKKPQLHVLVNGSLEKGRSVTFNFFRDGHDGRVAMSVLYTPVSDDIPNPNTWHHELVLIMAQSLPLDKIRSLDIEIAAHLPLLPRSMWLTTLSRARNIRELAVEARSMPVLWSLLRQQSSQLGCSMLIFPRLDNVHLVGGCPRQLRFLQWVIQEASVTRKRHVFGMTSDVPVGTPHSKQGPVVYLSADGTRKTIHVYPSNNRYKPRINSTTATKVLQDRGVQGN
ncbi:unnamed protein product [Peniophora sp. CBMAI 1063]|nr:unnamed protein product [Peniophora sp. CBMAI 1063]